MTKRGPRPPNLPFTPADFMALDHDPRLAAQEIYDYAPRTTDALIALYCEAYADNAPPGRHVQTVETKGDLL